MRRLKQYYKTIIIGIIIAVILIFCSYYTSYGQEDGTTKTLPENLVKNLCDRDFDAARPYPVTLKKVLDGDTQDVLVNHGLNVYSKQRLRLIGVDTPEKRGETKEAGLVATAFTSKFYDSSEAVLIKTVGWGKYGRPLAYVLNSKGVSLNHSLIASKNATYYCGGKRAK